MRAVKSALNQTCPPERIVVIDDGSCERDRGQLRSELTSMGVELIEIEHSGHPGVARKKGVENLGTDWVAFLDSDDEWVPTKLEVQLQRLNQTGNLASCSNAILRSCGKEYFKSDLVPNLIKTRDLVKTNSIICSSAIVARSLLLAVNGFADAREVRGAEDFATWLRVSLLSNWDYLDEPLVIYSDKSEDSLRVEVSKSNKSSHLLGLMNCAKWIKPKFNIYLILQIAKHKMLQRVKP